MIEPNAHIEPSQIEQVPEKATPAPPPPSLPPPPKPFAPPSVPTLQQRPPDVADKVGAWAKEKLVPDSVAEQADRLAQSKLGRWTKGKLDERSEQKAANAELVRQQWLAGEPARQQAAQVEQTRKALLPAADEAERQRKAASTNPLNHLLTEEPYYSPRPLPNLDVPPTYPTPPTLANDPQMKSEHWQKWNQIGEAFSLNLKNITTATAARDARRSLNELRNLGVSSANQLALQQYQTELSRFSQEAALYERVLAGDQTARWMLARRRAEAEAGRLNAAWGQLKPRDRKKRRIPETGVSAEQVLDYWRLPWQGPAVTSPDAT